MLFLLLFFGYRNPFSCRFGLSETLFLPVADSSDNSDLEDDIILALNE